MRRCERLLELLGELLGQHPDYSLNATMERMRGAIRSIRPLSWPSSTMRTTGTADPIFLSW